MALQNLILVGRMQAWMRGHLLALSRAFQDVGVSCEVVDSGELESRRWPGFRRRAESELRVARTRALLERLRRRPADTVLFYQDKVDFPRLRQEARVRVVFWDWDGRAGAPGNPGFPPESGIDLILTISRAAEKELRQRGSTPVRYLAHGAAVDAGPAAWASGRSDDPDGGPLVFVGRPTEKRQLHLEAVREFGLAVWGRKWRRRRWRQGELRGSIIARDVFGEELRRVYREADMALNIPQQEGGEDDPLLLSIQAFAIPAAGGGLLSEWMPELEEAYDPGREIVAYRTIEELRDLAARYTRDREAARAIARAGFERCRAEHTLIHRARQVMDWLGE